MSEFFASANVANECVTTNNIVDSRGSHYNNRKLDNVVDFSRYNSGKVGDVLTDLTRDEVDAKIDAAEARVETKIARLEGTLGVVISKLDGIAAQQAEIKQDTRSLRAEIKEDFRSARANQWVIAFGLAVLIVAIVAMFPVFFGIGTQIKDIIDKSVQTSIENMPKPGK